MRFNCLTISFDLTFVIFLIKRFNIVKILAAYFAFLAIIFLKVTLN